MKRFAALFGLLCAEFEEPVRLRVPTDLPGIRNMTADAVTIDPAAREFAAAKTSAAYPLCIFTK